MIDLNVINSRIRRIVESNGRIYIGCSGGRDSVALAHIVAASASRKNLNCTLAHVNYGLRGAESDEDHLFVQRLAGKLGFDFQLLDLRAFPKPSTGVQAWARESRFRWFRELLNQNDIIALGHHGGDLAENVLLRMARGSLSSLSGMSVEKDQVWRPLLLSSSADISRLVSRQKILYRDDSSNDKLDYSRNKIRWKVMPVLQGFAPRAECKIGRVAFEIDEIIREVDESNRALWATETLDLLKIKDLSPAIGRRVIQRFFKHNGSDGEVPSTTFARVWQAVRTQSTGDFELPGDRKLALRNGKGTLEQKDAFLTRRSQFDGFFSKHMRYIMGSDATALISLQDDVASISNSTKKPKTGYV
ncbi:MAG: tRNA lysidine(34) synthetase TilS [Pseudobacteriovorax sp.]|nr:tRNA lysidine(34) synthetase TilS [Pseudobacteriovorax sp.]